MPWPLLFECLHLYCWCSEQVSTVSVKCPLHFLLLWRYSSVILSLRKHTHIHTLRICNIYSSTRTTVAGTRLSVSLYVHCLPFYCHYDVLLCLLGELIVLILSLIIYRSCMTSEFHSSEISSNCWITHGIWYAVYSKILYSCARSLLSSGHCWLFLGEWSGLDVRLTVSAWRRG